MKAAIKILMAIIVVTCTMDQVHAQVNPTRKLTKTNNTCASSKVSKTGKKISRKGEDTGLEILTMNGRKVKTGSELSTANKTSKTSTSGKRIKREGTDVRHEIFSMNGRKVKTGGN